MRQIVADENLVAACGLYCGACGSYLKGRCPGCKENHKAHWCKVRLCCQENQWHSCAQCAKHDDIRACAKYNNMISKVIGFLLRSDRHAGIMRIKSLGRLRFASEMAAAGRHTVKR